MRALGVTTVIDLRRYDEVDRLGRGPVAEWSRIVVHAPLPQGDERPTVYGASRSGMTRLGEV